MEARIKALAKVLAAAERVAALTGAGVSAESGVPTFRGEGGLWRGHDPMRLATPQAFARDPALVWEFYNWRRSLVSGVDPNPAHQAVAAMERLVPDFTLVTQNVDGLHLKAGSKRVVEVHGSLWRVRCTECGQGFEDRGELAPLPRCTSCGGLLRPGVVWFGEGLDPEDWSRTMEACERCQVLLVAGTSAVVQPVASLAGAVKAMGRTVAVVNLEPTPGTTDVDFFLQGKAGEILPAVVAAWTKE